MINLFNLIVIFIFFSFLLNSYFLSIKQNSVKLLSFISRLFTSWYLSKRLSSEILKIKISNNSFEYIINNERIDNITDILKVLILNKFPDLSHIVNERIVSTYILESISIMVIRTFLLVCIYLIITLIYKIIMKLRKRKNKKLYKNTYNPSKLKGLGFGFIQGLIIVLLISIPFSGISSLINDVERLNDANIIDEELLILKEYRNTITGKMFYKLNINNKPLDVYMFDELFYFRYNEAKVLICDEVEIYVDIIQIINEKEIDYNLINNLEKDYLVRLNNKINQTKILNVSAPLVIDYYLYRNYELILNPGLYEVDYYNEVDTFVDLLVYFLNEEIDLDSQNIKDIDPHVVYNLIDKLAKLQLLDKLSLDITKELNENEDIQTFLKDLEITNLNLSEINYKYEINILRKVFNKILEIDKMFTQESIEELALLINGSTLFHNNQDMFFEYLINHYLLDYKDEIVFSRLKVEDIRSLIIIAKAYIDNGYLESYFRFSKLYDDKTLELLIEAIISSNLLRSNLKTIIKLFLKESNFNIDFDLAIPENLDFQSEVGKREIKQLLRLMQILNYGINQKNLELNHDEICDILRNSLIIRENIYNILDWLINLNDAFAYDIYLVEIDFHQEEGNIEINHLVSIFSLFVSKKILDANISEVLKFTKDDLDILFSSKIIEEALIHLLYDIGKDPTNPLIVKMEPNDPRWYKSSIDNGELRNFVYAIKIIFKDIEDLDEIEFTTDLILSIDNGTIDTNGDGVIDELDENELDEILKSKILSDTIITFIYNYYKEMNK